VEIKKRVAIGKRTQKIGTFREKHKKTMKNPKKQARSRNCEKEKLNHCIGTKKRNAER